MLEEVDGFDPSYRYAEDRDLFIRLREHGVEIAVLPEVVLHKRLHGANMTMNPPTTHPMLRSLHEKLERDAAGREPMTIESERLVTVVITVYNGAPYLAEAIDSVLAQTYRPFELIVLDDGSTDGSGEIARSYGSACRFAQQENAGLGAARNSAIELAKGRYYAFLDADDRFVPDKLERQMQILDAEPEIDMVFGHMTEFVSPEIDERARALLRDPVHDQPWRMPNLMLVRREAFHRVGPFSDTLRVGIGVDWYARAVDERPERGRASVPRPRAEAAHLEQRDPAARRPAPVPPRAEAVARPQALGRTEHAAHRRGLMAARPGLVGSFWPSPQQELLLRGALLDEERSVQAWRLLKPSLDIQRLERGSVVLLPMLYEKLQERGSTEEFVPRLKGVYRQVWYRNQLGLDVLHDLLRSLHDAGEEAIVIDEAALIARYYRRLGVRPLGRPTVLVRCERSSAVLDALVRSGWDASTRGSWRRREVERVRAGKRGSCAVHWRPPSGLELPSGHDGDRFWDGAQATEVRGVETRTLDTTRQLLWTLVAGARAGTASRRPVGRRRVHDPARRRPRGRLGAARRRGGGTSLGSPRPRRPRLPRDRSRRARAEGRPARARGRSEHAARTARPPSSPVAEACSSGTSLRRSPVTSSRPVTTACCEARSRFPAPCAGSGGSITLGSCR